MSTLPIFKDELETIIIDKKDLVVQEKPKSQTEQRLSKGQGLGGKPLDFNSVEELEEKIQEFRQYAIDNKVFMTVERLCVFLDIDRRTLLNYQRTEQYFHTISKIKREINAQKSETLLDMDRRNVNGVIFDLKNNHDYVDKIETVSKDGDLDQKQKMLDQFSTDVNKLDGISRNLNSRFLTE